MEPEVQFEACILRRLYSDYPVLQYSGTILRTAGIDYSTPTGSSCIVVVKSTESLRNEKQSTLSRST